MERRTTVTVIGGGQAGLSAAYHLQRRGFDFVVLDADAGPGGAWQHRWASLTMETVNGIFDLPGLPKPAIDPAESSSTAIPRYFAAYERAFDLPILRPVTVQAVERDGDDLRVTTDQGTWLTSAVINATGTWTNPLLPAYLGAETFRGRQLHTHEYTDAAEFAGRRVAIVGGGISAIQQLEEISRTATTFWYTRREPVFIDEFRPEQEGRSTIAKVIADVEAGRPSSSVVSYTGLGWTSYARAAQERGVLTRRPMFTAIEPTGVREADGTLTEVDTILWATGFRAALAHLEPLRLRGPLGGIPMRGTQVAAEPRIHLIGYGPSQSTIGANRAGREAVAALRRLIPEPTRI
ncbi:cation diffusion facilitator CzcD-associated flavoprotein CzcO [Actinoplanes lutulentus]|uniref:Pyridine nucleotide-disulfide oxidoreductase n=1 Tax=Actinoplanes lutulentus TaxID=1287878 RepID=A0A327Z546_9ACTN|nr:FAD-dependent oxidoreductase [Actinoplanes lutulentus]MBB2947728.1 cation diffusion facilitator CzcD-associated flavoprotein CzcO [Actinoplanes lutulentus]RAK27783.1 pyridine nucleotide-disulfide oxidoreductase [Actinoplanes lutulentus]